MQFTGNIEYILLKFIFSALYLYLPNFNSKTLPLKSNCKVDFFIQGILTFRRPDAPFISESTKYIEENINFFLLSMLLLLFTGMYSRFILNSFWVYICSETFIGLFFFAYRQCRLLWNWNNVNASFQEIFCCWLESSWVCWEHCNKNEVVYDFGNYHWNIFRGYLFQPKMRMRSIPLCSLLWII